MFNVGTNVKCSMSNKLGVVIRNEYVLGLDKTMAIKVKFDDGTNRIYLSDKCECLIKQ